MAVEIADCGEDLAVTIRRFDPSQNDLEMPSLHARTGRSDICAIDSDDHVCGRGRCHRSSGNFGHGLCFDLLANSGLTRSNRYLQRVDLDKFRSNHANVYEDKAEVLFNDFDARLKQHRFADAVPLMQLI